MNRQVVNALTCLAEKHDTYTARYQLILNMLSNVVSNTITLRDQHEQQKKAVDKITKANFVQVKIVSTDPRGTMSEPFTLDGEVRTTLNDIDKTILNQLKNMTFVQRDPSLGKGGVTWVELFIIHNLAGGKLSIKAKALNHRVTLEKAINEYKTRVLHLVKLAVKTHHAHYFAAAHNFAYPLEHLGINSAVASIKIGVELTQEQTVAKVTLGTRSRRTTHPTPSLNKHRKPRQAT